MFLLGILVALSVDFGSIIYDVLVLIVMLSRAAAKTIVKKNVSAVTYSSHFKLLHKYSIVLVRMPQNYCMVQHLVQQSMFTRAS